MYKNTASQKWTVFAFGGDGHASTGDPVTGDAGNITANLYLDGGSANAVDDTNPTEIGGGFYVFDLTQAETNADHIIMYPSSGTSDVVVIGVPGSVYTRTDQDLSTIEGKIDTIDGIVDSILEDTGTTLDGKLDNIAGATFDTATDSLEALRNRGDSAWTGSAVTSHEGTAQAGAASTITLASGASAANDTYNGQMLFISSGTGAGQSRAISDYVGATKIATVITPWATNPDATSVYSIYPDEVTEISPAPTAAAIADAVWDEGTLGHTSSGTFGEQVKNDIDAILVDTSATLDGKINTIDGIVDAILVDTAEIGAAGAGLTALVSQSSVDDIQSDVTDILEDTSTTIPGILGTPAGASLAADIATVDGVADGVKAKTDSLTFSEAGIVDANILKINDVTITGDGSGTPFGV